MLVLGLTGSVAMGKSTVAAFFAEHGVAIFDADRAVHDLYRGEAAPVVEAAFPGTVVNGTVDRILLSARVLHDRAAMMRLEAIVHPLVRQREEAFCAAAAAAGRRMALLDIPLLFEVGAEARVDAIIVASAPAELQRARLLARPGMDEARADAMTARQIPDAEKRRRAHFIVDTGVSLPETRRAVADLLRAAAAMAAAR
jgi:dephospho-CoA kinase